MVRHELQREGDVADGDHHRRRQEENVRTKQRNASGHTTQAVPSDGRRGKISVKFTRRNLPQLSVQSARISACRSRRKYGIEWDFDRKYEGATPTEESKVKQPSGKLRGET